MGGGSHEHRGHRSGAGPSGSSEQGPVATAFRLLRDAPPILVVTQIGEQFEIVELGGRLARWKADDRSHADESLGAGAETRARWDGVTIHAESDLGPRGTLTQNYTLGQGADGERQLRVTTTLRLTREDRTLTLRRTYVPAP